METTNINGSKCALHCKVISLGLDMQCHHVVTTSTILYVDTAEDKLIIESEEGIKIRLRMKDLKDFYLDTKENRDRLEAQCRKEYIEWKVALRKRLVTCLRRY